MKLTMMFGAALLAFAAVACGGSDKPAADPSTTSSSTSSATSTTGADADSDGIPDSADKCPDKKEDGATPDPKDGCPKAP